jgi:hypothetical protein
MRRERKRGCAVCVFCLPVSILPYKDFLLPHTHARARAHTHTHTHTHARAEGDSGGRVNILGDDNIGHWEKKSSYQHGV